MIQWRPVYVICMREFIKFFREKSRLLGTLARPVLWLFVVGNGMSSLIRPHVGFSYLQFIFPGMIGMTILFASIFSSISIVWDREFGFMKEMLVAPISRLSIVIGKAISGTLISVAQAVIILVLIPFLGIHITFMQFIEVVAVSEYIAAGIRGKIPTIGPRLRVIVNGIEPALFADPDREFWRRHPLVGERGPLLGVVGAFYKGQDELIALLPRLRTRFPHLALILIGLWLVLRNFDRIPSPSFERLLGLVLLYTNILAVLHFALIPASATDSYSLAEAGTGGGYLGALILEFLRGSLGLGGAAIALVAWLIIALTLTLDVSVADLFKWLPTLVLRLQDAWDEWRSQRHEAPEMLQPQERRAVPAHGKSRHGPRPRQRDGAEMAVHVGDQVLDDDIDDRSENCRDECRDRLPLQTQSVNEQHNDC